MRVLGIDPGYAIVGWGVVEYISNRFAPIGYGAVITEKDTPFEQRLVEIYESVFDICKRYQPEALSIEKLYYQHNQTTVIGVAEARGVILLAAAQCGVPIYEYTPMQVKQAITGYGKAVKKQIQEMTRIMLHLESVPKPDDTADALTVRRNDPVGKECVRWKTVEGRIVHRVSFRHDVADRTGRVTGKTTDITRCRGNRDLDIL